MAAGSERCGRCGKPVATIKTVAGGTVRVDVPQESRYVLKDWNARDAPRGRREYHYRDTWKVHKCDKP